MRTARPTLYLECSLARRLDPMPDFSWLVSPTVSIFVGIGAVLITNRLTRKREDRARALQQKREVCADALTAVKEYVDASREADFKIALAHQALQATRDAWEPISENERVRQEIALGGTPEQLAELDRRLARLNHVHDGMRADAADKTARSTEATHVRGRAQNGLDHWAAMLDLTCSPAVVNAYRELCQVTNDETRARFIAAVKADIAVVQEPTGVLRRLAGEVYLALRDDIRRRMLTKPSAHDNWGS